MTNALLNGNLAAASSASAAQLQKNKLRKRSGRYAAPIRPAHLSDKFSRAADQQLGQQFFKTSRSITPPPGTTGWAPRNNVLLSLDGTKNHESFSRPKLRSNQHTQADATTAPMKLRILAAPGGSPAMHNVMSHAISTGRFDAEIRTAIFAGQFDTVIQEYLGSEQSASLRNNNISLETFYSAEDLNAKQKALVESRAIAEKRKTPEEINMDPKIGAISQRVSFAELDREQEYDLY
jgi:hypothetical protein